MRIITSSDKCANRGMLLSVNGTFVDVSFPESANSGVVSTMVAYVHFSEKTTPSSLVNPYLLAHQGPSIYVGTSEGKATVQVVHAVNNIACFSCSSSPHSNSSFNSELIWKG